MNLIDNYLATNVKDHSKRTELERIRQIALNIIPEPDETIAYGMPTVKYRGKSVIGFDAHQQHIGIYPYSGSVIANIKELADYETSSGAIREKLTNPLPKQLIEKIILERLDQLGFNN